MSTCKKIIFNNSPIYLTRENFYKSIETFNSVNKYVTKVKSFVQISTNQGDFTEGLYLNGTEINLPGASSAFFPLNPGDVISYINTFSGVAFNES